MLFQLSGNTRTVPLSAVLQVMQLLGVSGMLSVRGNAIEKCIHFRNGQIVFATSTDARDRLGEVLVKAGFLSQQNLEQGLVLFKKQAGFKKIGAILVENKFVSPKNLYAGLKTQVKDIIYSLFLWSDADFRFEENIATDILELQINMQELIAEIITRIKSGE
jgi:hypothetical protein